MMDLEVAHLNVKLTIDDNDMNKSMASLNRSMKLVQSEFQAASSKLGDFGKGAEGLKLKADSLTKQLEIQQDKVAKLAQRHAESAEKKGKDAVETQKLETQLNKAVAEYNRLDHELKQTTAELERQTSVWTKLSNTLDDAGNKLKSVGQKMKDVGKTLTTTITAPMMAVSGLALKTSIDFESAFAGVRKTVNATEEEFAYFKHEMREMAKVIPATANEIARVGEAAGQLGIENEHLLTFTRTMVDLGVATDMSSEQAAMTLARLANITNMSQENFDRLGSTLVELGNNFAATEYEISEMALRIAGAGTQIKMSEADILGFSTALASVGIKAEAGGTAISKLMIEMASEIDMGGDRLDEFARVAGMSVDHFVHLFEQDAATAIITFLGGLGDLSEEGESAFRIIDELGLSEIRLRDTILRSSNARELANRALVTANEAWEENVALTDEAEERYKTTASQLQIFKNRLTDVGITLGDALIPALLDLLDALQPMIDLLGRAARWFSSLDESKKRVIITIGVLVAALGPALVIMGTLTASVGSILTTFGRLSAAIQGAGGVMALFTRLVGLAITPVKALGTAILFLCRNPIGIAITIIASLAIFIISNWEQVKTFFINLLGWLKDFFSKWGLVILAVLAPFLGVPLLIFKNWDKITNFFSNLWEKVKENFEEELAWFDNLKEMALEWGKNLVSGFIDGIKSFGKMVGNTVSSLLIPVKDHIGFNSPAKKGEGRHIVKWGANMVDGFLDGVDSMIPKAQEKMNSLIANMNPSLDVSVNSLRDQGTLNSSYYDHRQITVHVDASNQDDINYLLNLFNGLKQTQRKMGMGGAFS